jgi:hypothetical protein
MLPRHAFQIGVMGVTAGRFFLAEERVVNFEGGFHPALDCPHGLMAPLTP